MCVLEGGGYLITEKGFALNAEVEKFDFTMVLDALMWKLLLKELL